MKEVTDGSVWYKNKLNYADKDGSYIISYTSSTSGGKRHVINTEVVQTGELTSYHDYLSPRWKGKISMKDPTQAGKGLNWFHLLLANKKLDIDYMKSLAKTEPVISRDERMQLEWVVRGKYPIALNISPEPLAEFVKIGLPVTEIALKEDLNTITAGAGGNVSLISQPPHPNAAKVYLNWLLSKEGQAIYTRAGGVQSRRLDTPTDHLAPDRIRDPLTGYFNSDNEDVKTESPKYEKLAQEIFGPLLK